MGNPFVHVELHTDDVKAAKKFYRGLFDWKLDDAKLPEGGLYTMIAVGKGTGGGMMTKHAPQAPSAWLTYVEVADVKKTLAKAQKLGAQIITDFHDLPGMGALGVIADPSGALLGVWQPAKPPPKVKAASSAKAGASRARKPAASRRR